MNNIPKDFIDFAQEVAVLARKRGFRSITATFRPTHFSMTGWDNDVTFSWTQVRHDEAPGTVHVSTTMSAWVEAELEKADD
jgi:hypothetical protein